ncbi:MAG TPA: fatty acid--CoA ligase family protein, partial [Acidimicrobiales bacterium]|nr:fatty acid--CoA ligase family protein [Acidimicrobiales bacterium]
VVSNHFTADQTIELIERHRVTVMAAVSTQFIMMLGSPAMGRHDLTSLRALFTGGEAVPFDRAARFEIETGARVLQFYGSNETGALSRTSTTDTRDQRLRTAGRVIDDMHVRLYDDDGEDITATGGPGQPGCCGPATCIGYYDDPEANARLVRPDGWMLTGDIATIDADGYLSVVGRKSDIIIRGGKNISAPAVEEAVLSHPDVRMAAAVAMPSDVFGERVCVYAVLAPGSQLTLADVCAHLEADGVGKDMWLERLVVVDALPVASGGKVAKSELRDDIKRRLATEA